MIIKVKWHFKEAISCIGGNFSVKGFSIQNGKGVGEIEVEDGLSDEILGEVCASSFSIISVEESAGANLPDSPQEDYIQDEQDVEDDRDEEGFMVLTGSANTQNPRKISHRNETRGNNSNFTKKTNKVVEGAEEVEEVSVNVREKPTNLTNQTAQRRQAPKCDYVRTMDELYEQFEIAAKTKISQISPENMLDAREKMLAEEQKAKEEAIDIPAWIVNKKYASLTINDIGMGLNLNMPVDLSRYSAKKLRVSRDLKNLLMKNYIELVSPQEATDIFNKNNSTTIDFNELGQTKDKKQALQEIRSGKFDSRFSDDGNYTPEENEYNTDDGSIDLTNDIEMHSHRNNGPNKINGKFVQKQNSTPKNNGMLTSNSKPKFKPIRPVSEM